MKPSLPVADPSEMNPSENSFADQPSSCCSVPRLSTVAAIAMVGLLMTTSYLVGRNRTLSTELSSAAVDTSLLSGSPMVEIDGEMMPIVDATAAVVSEKYSLATGPVSDDSEGLFMLDHNSGLLQCQVIYPRAGRVMAQYVVNVNQVLGGGGKGGEYLMLTGRVNFQTSSNRPAASVVVYVMDTSTGNFAAYGLPFNNSMVNSNQPQNGALQLVTQGSANPLIDRDSLR